MIWEIREAGFQALQDVISRYLDVRCFNLLVHGQVLRFETAKICKPGGRKQGP